MIIPDGDYYIIEFNNTRYLGPQSGGRFETREQADNFIDTVLVQHDKEAAWQAKLSEINKHKHVANLENFAYTKPGGDVHTYIADRSSIQATQNICLAMAPNDPVPVPQGAWKTADTLDDGLTPVYESFTCAEFIAFARAFFDRGAANFGVAETHRAAVTAIYANHDSSVDDILSYDCTGGWIR